MCTMNKRDLAKSVAVQSDVELKTVTAVLDGFTDVVTAVSQAELALQTTTAIRDRVVQAYQDIMRIQI